MASRTVKEVNLSRNQTQQLIELYECEEDLWNVSSDRYHKKECRDAALMRIKEKLGEEMKGILCRNLKMYTHIHVPIGFTPDI